MIIKPQTRVAFHAVMFNNCIQVIDMCQEFGTTPITFAPDEMIAGLVANGYEVDRYPILYLDEDEIWDHIAVKNGTFDKFWVFHQHTWEGAVQVLLNNQMMDQPKFGDDRYNRFWQPWDDGANGSPDPHLILTQ